MHTLNNNAESFGTQEFATELGLYKDIVKQQGEVQPHWSSFLDLLENLGPEELKRKQRDAHRLLRENGVTYNVYGDDQSFARPWQLDPVPMLLSEKEWETIETGLRQRAELLNLILKDVYHDQKLIKKGLLPMELVYKHQGFLRPCMGALNRLKHQLVFYSANLARGPDGRMWVLDDRTQAPSGSGYALENRTVMTRVLPNLFQEIQVKRLAGFFRMLHQGLCRLMPHKENPRIVILTPGPFNETYFEHAYLSSYLGYSLVQGDDLTVRDGRVWLKSLEGLQAVDVILRRVDDIYCDPLELFSESKLGVAGLLEAVRQGNVGLANPLGCSMLENPALLAFLPSLARHFLGEELLLPSVATWWCGQKKERDFVLKNLNKLIIKPINRQFDKHLIFGYQLSKRELENLRNQISADPYLFVGQEQIDFSMVPALADGHIESRNAVLRHFLVAQQEDDYQAMPGGLTRIAQESGNLVVSSQTGGVSKDTWVLTATPDPYVSLWPQAGSLSALEAVTEPLSSRVADNLFWVGRNLERLELSSRLMRSALAKHKETLEFGNSEDMACQQVLLQCLTHVTATYPGFVSKAERNLASPQAELMALALERQRAGTLAATLQNFVNAAIAVRDIWSRDTWRSIDNLKGSWDQYQSKANDDLANLENFLDRFMTAIAAFNGCCDGSMSRETGWLILDCGRKLERAINHNILIRTVFSTALEEIVLSQVLESILIALDCLSMYKRRYRSYIQPVMVLELLLLDQTYPRSVLYQLKNLHAGVSALPRQRRKGKLSKEERLSLEAYMKLRLLEPGDVIDLDTGSAPTKDLTQVLLDTNSFLFDLSKIITQTYFSHAHNAPLAATVSVHVTD